MPLGVAWGFRVMGMAGGGVGGGGIVRATAPPRKGETRATALPAPPPEAFGGPPRKAAPADRRGRCSGWPDPPSATTIGMALRPQYPMPPCSHAPMQRESIAPFFAALQAANPTPGTELEYTSVFELLTAVLLSAQATDVGVNKATRRLFAV